jgi:GNAT superfamily N-acetyltransferase
VFIRVHLWFLPGMASIIFRTIATDERDAVLDLLADWLNDRAFFARYFEHDPAFRDDLCFVAVDGGRIVSTLQVFRKRVHVDGATLAVGGVGNVYTDPAYRTAGLATALLERALAAMAAQGFDASLLFASQLDFYARLGWRTLPRVLSFIEPGGTSAPGAAAVFEPRRDLDQVMAVYAVHSVPVAGATARDAAYWAGQLRYAGNPDERFVVTRRDECVVAYARATTLYGFNTIVEHGCLPGEEPALADLVLHLHHGAPTGTIAQLAPSVSLEQQLVARGLSVKSVDDHSWMWRAIDPERLAWTLGVPQATVTRNACFAELFPAGRSRYWLSDRF